MQQNNWAHDPHQHTAHLIEKGVGSRQFYQAIEQALPPVFSRKVASQAIGGLLSVKTMANLDAERLGPSVKVKIGSRVGYERDSFMTWLKGRIRAM